MRSKTHMSSFWSRLAEYYGQAPLLLFAPDGILCNMFIAFNNIALSILKLNLLANNISVRAIIEMKLD